MNPLVVDLLGSLFRWGLTGLSAYLVTKGIWTQEQATQFVAAVALALVSLCWTLWKTYSKRLKFVTALTLPPGSTERDVEQRIQSPILSTPAASTPKDVAPTLG